MRLPMNLNLPAGITTDMSLLHMSLTGAILILAIVVVRTVTAGRLPKRTFVLLWKIALLRLLLPFSIPFRFSAYSLINDNTPVREMFTETGLFPLPNTGQPAANVDVTQPALDTGFSISPWLLLWGIGTACCAVFFLISWIRCRLEFRTSLPVDNRFVDDWLDGHPTLRPITIRQSDQISAPLTYGILFPVILMPHKTDWENHTQLQYILLHEYVHIRRLDAAAKLIATAALCIHWFNPMVWVLYFLFNRDIELSCDERVVRRFGLNLRSAYARTLIAMEEKKSGLTPLCNNFSKNAIEERITAIMRIRKLTLGVICLSVAVTASLIIMFATSAHADTPNNAGDGNSQADISSASDNKADWGSAFPDISRDNDEDTLTERLPGTTLPSEESPVTPNIHDRDNSVMLEFVLEGMPEERSATLYTGNTYSVYIPDGDWKHLDTDTWIPEGDWRLVDADTWVAVNNDYVQFGFARCEGTTQNSVEEVLYAQGYQYNTPEYDPTSSVLVTPELERQEDGIFFRVQLYGIVGSEDVWAVYYSYPVEAVEGYGLRLPVILKTAWVSAGVDGDILPTDRLTALATAQAFATACFDRDADALSELLFDGYEGKLDFYDDADSVEILNYKGFDDIGYVDIGDRQYVSVEFLADGDDSFTYLSLTLLRQTDGWTVLSYWFEK